MTEAPAEGDAAEEAGAPGPAPRGRARVVVAVTAVLVVAAALVAWRAGGDDGGPVVTAADLVVGSADLPSGWVAYQEPTNAPGAPTTAPEESAPFCGVAGPAGDTPPTQHALAGFGQGTGGPFFYEMAARYGSAAEVDAAVAATAALLADCGGDGRTVEAADIPGAPAGARAYTVRQPRTGEPEVSTSMGGTGGAGMGQARFYVSCDLARRRAVDPIVFPGVPETPGAHDDHGAGHDDAPHPHDFFGSDAVTESSTGPDLLSSGDTTCSFAGDRSSYWVPQLRHDGDDVLPDAVRAYYSTPAGVPADDVVAAPVGLQLLAGDGSSTAPQDPAVVGWSCGESFSVDGVSPEPPEDCTADAALTLRLVFPSCWNGSDLASADHRSHLAYPAEAGGCPPSHPVAIPEETLMVAYGLYGPLGTVELASGAPVTAHGDTLSAWAEGEMESLIDRCLRTGTDCASTGTEGYEVTATVVVVPLGEDLLILTHASFDELDPAVTADLVAAAVAQAEGQT